MKKSSVSHSDDKQLRQSILQQENWRKKQLHLLYESGRPLFNKEKSYLHGPVFPSFLLRDLRGSYSRSGGS